MPLCKSFILSRASQISLSSSKAPRCRSISRLSFHDSDKFFIESEKNQRHFQISSTKKLHHNFFKKELQQFKSSFQHRQGVKGRKRGGSVATCKKQSQSHNIKIEESKSKKYIINEPKLPEKSKTLSRGSTKPKSSLSSMHNKTLSNQTILNFAITKSPSKSKLKKKTPQYIKSHNPTINQNKSFSLFPKQKSANVTHMNNSSQMELYRQQNGNQSIATLQKVSFFNSKELQHLRQTHKKVLTRIEGELIQLVTQLGQRKGERLVGVVGGYDKIITELYQVLKDQDQKNNGENQVYLSKTPPLHQQNDTTDNTSASQSTLHNRSTSIDPLVPSIDEIISNLSTPNSTIPDSEYRDSLTQNLIIKKLNLTNLKQSFQVKDYHEEFLDMKEGFSESWKRELQKQRKF